jgi:hypothetical protein
MLVKGDGLLGGASRKERVSTIKVHFIYVRGTGREIKKE